MQNEINRIKFMALGITLMLFNSTGALNFCLACIGAGSNGNSCLNSLVLW